MTLEDKVQSFRLHALQRAKVLRNVTAACLELGISRTVFYRWKSRFKRYGADGLHPTRRSASRGRPPALSLQDEQSILALAVGDIRHVGLHSTRTC
jgi:ACT domain-containing protein